MDIPLKIVNIVCFMVSVTRCAIYVPDLPLKQYVQGGDINLGGLFPVSGRSPSGKPCGPSLRSLSAVQIVEAMVYAIETVNNDTDLLPNVTLGFAILDDCSKPTTSLAQATRFAPVNYSDACVNDSYSTNSEYKSNLDVVGVVGSLMSSLSVQSGSYLGVFQIPQISYSSTSDELSDKGAFPYFLRVVPPDTFQVRAIVDLIENFKWDYISAIYVQNSYGQAAIKTLRELTTAKGICIAVDESAPFIPTDAQYDSTVSKLIKNSNAKVVVLFLGPFEAKGIFEAVRRANATGKFIWIGSDGWGARIQNLGDSIDVAEHAFTFQVREIPLPDFEAYFQALNPEMKLNNPWFKQYWESFFGCSFDIGSANQCNESETVSYANGYSNTPLASMVVDSVYTFAHAINTLIRSHCPNAQGNDVRSCVNGPLLLQYLKQTTFTGRLGTIVFDDNGDMEGQYLIQQVHNTGSAFVQEYFAIWDARLNKLTAIKEDGVHWPPGIVMPDHDTPESVCSKPCKPGQFTIPQELKCCWLCQDCRDNEYVASNMRSCNKCPKFHWPDQTNFTSCEIIPPVYLKWSDPLGILLLLLSILGIAGTIAIFAFFVRHNNKKLIKACSRELAHLMLAGVAMGFLLVLLMITIPTRTSCYVTYFGYTVSFTLVYAPLLTRTNRIYRIFESSRHNKSPMLISPRSQVVIALILILIQILISAVTSLIYPPLPELIMAVETVRHVELECPFKIHGFISFLSYNIILVVACSAYAFKTRKLPNNFNESRFISLCIYTTVVVWIAFIPTYFTTSTSYYKVLLLSMALIVNNTIVLAFLYLPKIYALVYVDEESMKLNATYNPSSTVYPTTNTTVSAASMASFRVPTVSTSALKKPGSSRLTVGLPPVANE